MPPPGAKGKNVEPLRGGVAGGGGQHQRPDLERTVHLRVSLLMSIPFLLERRGFYKTLRPDRVR